MVMHSTMLTTTGRSKVLALATLLVTVVAALPAPDAGAATDALVVPPESDDTAALFASWKAKHGKVYGSLREDEIRLEVFKANAQIVAAHNAAFEGNATTYALTLDGPFSDLDEHEFAQLYLQDPQHCSATHISSGPVPVPPGVELADSDPKVDWRTKGAVTAVKNQKSCGSCWTFSSTGAIESHTCIKEKRDCADWSGLAEQQLVDCAQAFDNHGCEGGLPSQAFEYVKYAGGIEAETSYAYTAKDEACKFDAKEISATVPQGSFNITAGDEDGIVTAVQAHGPVSIAYQVASDFRLYSHGVYDSYDAKTGKPVCKDGPADVNHAVLVVGLDSLDDDKKTPFYIIKNSWGNTWGMLGYFAMVRGKNMCGVSDCSAYPLV